MIKDSLKNAIAERDLDAIYDELAKEYVASRDDYMVRACGSGNLPNEQTPHIINSLKNNDIAQFKNQIKSDIYDHALTSLNLLTELLKSNMHTKHMELIQSFVDKIFHASPNEIDMPIDTPCKTFFGITSAEIKKVTSYTLYLTHSNRLNDALDLLQFLTFVDPADYDIWKNLGCVYLKLGYHQNAITAFDRAIALDPECPLAYEGVCLALHGDNQIEQANELYKELHPQESQSKF